MPESFGSLVLKNSTGLTILGRKNDNTFIDCSYHKLRVEIISKCKKNYLEVHVN